MWDGSLVAGKCPRADPQLLLKVNMVQPVASFQKRLSVGSTQPPDGDAISFSSNHRRHGISHSAR